MTQLFFNLLLAIFGKGSLVNPLLDFSVLVFQSWFFSLIFCSVF
jgi:hypothetical protein